MERGKVQPHALPSTNSKASHEEYARLDEIYRIKSNKITDDTYLFL